MSVEAPAVRIEEYKNLVDRCARERLDYVISNGSPVHARILIAKLFETARQSAVIISGQLIDVTPDGEDIYGYAEVIGRALKFLRREGTKLRVILQEPIHRKTENRFLGAIVNDPQRKGDIIIYPDTRAVTETLTPHLMVTDALAYRLELDTKRVEAFANFGDSASATMVQQLFEKLEGYVKQLKKTPLQFSPGSQFARA